MRLRTFALKSIFPLRRQARNLFMSEWFREPEFRGLPVCLELVYCSAMENHVQYGIRPVATLQLIHAAASRFDLD